MTPKLLLLILLSISLSTGLRAQTANINPDRKNQFGMGIGVSTSRFTIEQSNWHQGTINYNDSLSSIERKSSPQLDICVFYQHNFDSRYSFRTVASINIGSAGKAIYHRTGSDEEVKLTAVPINIAVPFIIKLSGKKGGAYTYIGPAFGFLPGSKKTEEKVPLKKFDVMIHSGLGWDIVTSKFIMSPDLKISLGLMNLKKDMGTLYTNTIDKLTRQSITFSLYFRG